MPLVPLTSPYSMNAAQLSIDVDDFTAAVSQVQFDPAVQVARWRGIGGNVISGQSVAEWTCQLGIAQDLAPTGLLRYLLEHAGEVKSAVLLPESGGPSVTVSLIIAPATIGGTAGADLTTSSVSLACNGAPVFDDTPGV